MLLGLFLVMALAKYQGAHLLSENSVVLSMGIEVLELSS